MVRGLVARADAAIEDRFHDGRPLICVRIEGSP
jgi:hypothetical protein